MVIICSKFGPKLGVSMIKYVPATLITRARQSETQGDLSSSSLSKYQGERGHWAQD